MIRYFILFVFTIGMVFGVYVLQESKKEIIYPEPVFTYEDCLKLEGSKKATSYPNKCVTKDDVVFLETIREPVDTSSWQVFDTGLDYTFKCPPFWSCLKWEMGVSIESPYYYVGLINIGRVSLTDYDDSQIRHPSYTNPRKWLTDVLAKKPDAIKVYERSIKNAEGTSQRFAPAYYDTDFSKIREIDAVAGKGVVLLRENNDVYGIVPIGENSVVTIAPLNNSYEDPVVKGIISSITVKTSSP